MQEILALRVQTKAAYGYGLTFLNRSRRGLIRVRKHYAKHAAKMGFTPSQISASYNDVKDMAKLEEACA